MRSGKISRCAFFFALIVAYTTLLRLIMLGASCLSSPRITGPPFPGGNAYHKAEEKMGYGVVWAGRLLDDLQVRWVQD